MADKSDWITRVNRVSLKLLAKDGGERKPRGQEMLVNVSHKSHLLIRSFTLISPLFLCATHFNFNRVYLIQDDFLFPSAHLLSEKKKAVAMKTLHHGDGSSENKANLI